MKLGIISLLGILTVFLALSGTAHAADRVLIEYFYMSFSESCPGCGDPNVVRVNGEVELVELEYGEEVVVERLDMLTSEGQERWNFYDLGYLFRPTVVINGTIVVKDTPEEPITKEKLSDVIDEYLGRTDRNPFTLFRKSFQRVLSSEIFVAFSKGFYSGFHPCLIVMLAFILSYTVSTSKGLKSSMTRTFAFGLGLVTAATIVGVLILSFWLSLFSFMTYLDPITLGVAIVMMIAGLSLTGVLQLPISAKPFIQRLTGKYGYTLLGLFLLGTLFFFAKDDRYAFPLFIILSFLHINDGAIPVDLGLFLAFSLGLLVPFLLIGIIGGVFPKLTREIREKHRLEIRAFSGVVLIAYGVWLLFWLIM